MKLYLGSRDYRPEGYLTVDIDRAHAPDILADVGDLATVASATVEEICASHILEHLAWPLGYKALAEWARVLKVGGVLRVAVPDLRMLAEMIASGRNVWHAAGLVYGLGRIGNPFEAHQYGYTSGMLISILRSLGFDGFGWWKHDMPDASNGWMFEDDSQKIAISLNIRAVKTEAPVVDPALILGDLSRAPIRSFDQILAERLIAAPDAAQTRTDNHGLLIQQMHAALIEARQRIVFLEGENRALLEAPRPTAA